MPSLGPLGGSISHLIGCLSDVQAAEAVDIQAASTRSECVHTTTRMHSHPGLPTSGIKFCLHYTDELVLSWNVCAHGTTSYNSILDMLRTCCAGF